MTRLEHQQSVIEILRDFRGLEPLKQLFWSELNYQRINRSLSRHRWATTAAQALAEDPVLFASGGRDDAFHVIYAHLASDKLLLTHERPVVARLLRDHPYALFVFSNVSQDYWHFLNVKYDGKAEKRRLFRRITIGPEEHLRTASERLTMLDLASLSADPADLSPLAVQQRHDEAFDVEAVTKLFFEEYKAIFGILQDDLVRQTNDRTWAHDYALQFLNRCMFLYFVQRKRWLGNDTAFLRSFWGSYQGSEQAKNTFFDRWLKVLFFAAFNQRSHGGYQHFPQRINEALAFAPHLNGGLFRENDLDRAYRFAITDSRFVQVFTFLERYNFTITEDSPLDQEVAVDPEMIGKVYESLVNVSTEADERGDAGIFYTPRTEIDLMCRLALVDYLCNHLGQQRKDLLYESILALEPDEKASADAALAKAKLWPDLDARLREITIIDPACGSGSFLVGMLYILDDLQTRAAKQLGVGEAAYDRKKRLIGQHLYGVDTLEWACHVAELRLWLALIIDAEFTREELHLRREPLLPHFTFKLRCGDSLVQEIGGLNLGHMRGTHHIPQTLRTRISKLKAEKLKFYNNDPTCRFHSANEAMHEELRLFHDILDARHHTLQEEIKTLQRKIAGPTERQMRLDGTIEERTHQLELEAIEWQKQVEELSRDLGRVDSARAALKSAKDVPFVWDIAFVEIFEGDKQGFDIVIGNPPYVRQENITDPHIGARQASPEEKRAYKAKLARSVYQVFPRFFGYRPKADSAVRKIDAKSDLYIYFYFHGLSLLNPKGSFCFITSNSWLDVGYGKDLQEFLLKHCHIKMLLDSQARRVFTSADVNTVIILLSAPNERHEWGLDHTARFVLFKVPFEHVLSPVIFEEIERVRSRKITPEYQVYPVVQKALLDDGCQLPEEDDTAPSVPKGTITTGPLIKAARYTGSKWGGKYLRAPDIYWTLLERCRDKLVPLGSIADVRFGIKTGANKFFYLDEAQIQEWSIEQEFLQPVILRPAEIVTPEVRREHLNVFLLIADRSRTELQGTQVEQYIRWGESQGFHRTATCAARGRSNSEWYRLQARTPAPLVLPIVNKMRLVLGINEARAQVSDNCVEIRPAITVDIDLAAALMLGSFHFLLRHIEGRSYGRMLKVQTYEAARLALHDPRTLPASEATRLLHAFEMIRSREFQWLVEEMETPEREAFDRVWLSLHGFQSEGEQTKALAAIHEAVRGISNEMDVQEQDWVQDRSAARVGGNPQDLMKGKRVEGQPFQHRHCWTSCQNIDT